MSAVKRFLARKDVEVSFDRYGLGAVGALALGLFASLLVGTISQTLATQVARVWGETNALTVLLTEMGKFAMAAAGPAMAISIGHALKAPPLVLFTLCGVGMAANAHGGAGGPLAVLVVTLVATECGKLVSRETKIDILVTPLVTLAVGVGLALWWAPAIGAASASFGEVIMWATDMQPLLMGALVAVLVGIALTLPISSAAICAALGLTGLAGGAALAGCCAQMVGFAVMSLRENRTAGLVAQGIGTSMLQFHNILRKPVIWLPTILTSAITGPLATCLFELRMDGPPIAAGMGTCGLVGPIGVLTGWSTTGVHPGAWEWTGLAFIAVVLPALLTLGLDRVMRRMGWYEGKDLSLDL